MERPPIDAARAEAFGARVLQILNDACLALMISVGHRTGLFDTLARIPSATSEGVAAEAKLQERYVREWLGAMVVGGIVEFDPETRHYSLPAEHAAALTRQFPADNVGVFAQYIPLLGSVEDRIVECFHGGGGVPYSAFGRFQEVMAEDSGQSVGAALIDQILPMAPGLPEALGRGIEVLDVGCGAARALNLMARTFPNSTFTGYDLDQGAIEAGREEARRHGVENLRLEVRDVTDLGREGHFDLVTAFDAIHDQASPDLVLDRIAHALKPGGIFLMQDIDASSHVDRNREHPIGVFLYTVSCLHCMTVSLAQGGMGLGAVWGREKALEMLEAAGFTGVEVKRLPHDIQNCYYVARRG